MTRRPQTKGVCQICRQVVGKSAMTRHLEKCLAAPEEGAEVVEKPPKTVPLLLILAQGKSNPQYWLYVEMPATATLRDLDNFLRHIWLECCGHLSAFNIAGTSYSVDMEGEEEEPDDELDDPLFGFASKEASMDVPVGKVLQKGTKFTHDYDFGSTTKLELRVVGEREGKKPKEEVRLVARNEPPEILCEKCEKRPAKWIDTFEDYGFFCEKCVKDPEEGFLPVVNSPRVGVCGYTGD